MCRNKLALQKGGEVQRIELNIEHDTSTNPNSVICTKNVNK